MKIGLKEQCGTRLGGAHLPRERIHTDDGRTRGQGYYYASYRARTAWSRLKYVMVRQ